MSLALADPRILDAIFGLRGQGCGQADFFFPLACGSDAVTCHEPVGKLGLQFCERSESLQRQFDATGRDAKNLLIRLFEFLPTKRDRSTGGLNTNQRFSPRARFNP